MQGFPESVAADVLRGEINRSYQHRIDCLINPLAKYWSTPEQLSAVENQVTAIKKERDDLLSSLGLQFPAEGTPSALPPEKQEYVAEALKRFPKQTPGIQGAPEEWARALEARKARVNYLSQFLSPEELLTYRITQDGNAASIGRIMADLNLSDGEFRGVFSTLDGEDLGRTNGFFRPDLEEKLRQTLGDERYREYHVAAAPENFLFKQFIETSGLTEQQVEDLNALRSQAPTMTPLQYRAAAAQILQRPLLVRRFLVVPPPTSGIR